MVCTQLERPTLKLLEKRVREVEKRFQNQKLGLPAAVTKEDKPKLPLEEDLSEKPWIHLPKAEPRVGQQPGVLQLIQATKCPETASAVSPGCPLETEIFKKKSH